jgi:hypothetical protein
MMAYFHRYHYTPFVCGGGEAELLHQRCKERFAKGACWVVKITPRGRTRLSNDHELRAARLVPVPPLVLDLATAINNLSGLIELKR